MNTVCLVLQTAVAVGLAPLVSGLIRKVKNSVRMRRGAPVLQPYYNLAKLMAKGEVISETTSWIFFVTPYIVLSAMIAALFLVPVFGSPISAFFVGDALTLFFLLALSRFFLALAGLDAGSAFGGMGSSREMFISSLVEPVAVTAIAVVGWQSGSLNVQAIASNTATSFSGVLASAALFFVILAETSRVPVDNQETHLELTMIHEAMILEYSGKSLGLLEWAAHIKQFILFSLLACILWPLPTLLGAGPVLFAAGFFLGKVFLCAVLVAFVEIALAKMRLFRVVDFMAFGFALSLLALVAYGLGR